MSNKTKPSTFKYQKVLEKGRPVHEPNDDFLRKHPRMDLTRRAKIFSPFDALKGYDEEIERTRLENEEKYLTEYVPIEEAP